jgi:hypothetical protein
MEAACSFEALVSTYEVRRCHESDQNVNLRCYQSLKSYMTEDGHTENCDLIDSTLVLLVEKSD